MAVEQDDFVGLRGQDVVGVPHADHVLGELALAFQAALALHHGEGFEAFLTQAVEHVDGRDVGIAFAARTVRFLSKDRGGDPENLVVGQGNLAAQRVGIASKVTAKGALHGDSPFYRQG
ncbi:hypothetical protein D3C84_964500 [compost metagenome]